MNDDKDSNLLVVSDIGPSHAVIGRTLRFEGEAVRVALGRQRVWWFVIDIVAVFEFEESQLIARVDESELSVFETRDGENQILVSDFALSQLLTTDASLATRARAFHDWRMREALPRLLADERMGDDEDDDEGDEPDSSAEEVAELSDAIRQRPLMLLEAMCRAFVGERRDRRRLERSLADKNASLRLIE